MPTTRFRRGPLATLPTAGAGEPLLTTDQIRLYVGAGGNRLVGLLHRIDATTDPGAGDDSADGYSPGSLWVNTTADTAFVCVDATAGAAVWVGTAGTPGPAGPTGPPGAAGPNEVTGATATTLTGYLKGNGSLVSAAANVPAADVSGLGDAATKNVGTTAGTVAAGDDSRLSDTRTPTDNTVGTAKIQANAVTLGNLAQVATARLLGRSTAGTGDVEALTGTQATALLDAFTSSLKGLAPASGGGTTNYLRADGTWAAPAAGASAATQAEQEAGSSTAAFTSPGRQQFHPSAAKAWVRFSVSGGVVTVNASYNVSSVTRTGAGDFTVNFTTAFSSANYALAGSVQISGSVSVGPHGTASPTATQCRLYVVNPSGALTDPPICFACFFGDQ